MPAFLSLLTALGWSLLDSVWQMGLLWTVCYLLTVDNKRISATGKHNLVILFVIFGVEWFGYSFFHLLKVPRDPVVSGLLPVSTAASRWIPYFGGLYLVVLTVRFLQFGLHRGDRLINKSPISHSPLLQSFTDRYIRILGITKPVSVYLSEMTQTAVTSGFFKPLILLPVSLLTRLSPVQVEAILIHELYHIRRNDYLINIGMSCFRSIFFFNPFAHLFFKAMERDRELACDDGVLELGYDPGVYAEALFSLEKYRQVNPGFSLAADGNKPWLLMERIRRVLGEPPLKEKRFNPLLLSGLAAAFVFFGLQMTAISPGDTARPADAAASVHYEIPEEKIALPAPELFSRSSQKPLVTAIERHRSMKMKLVKRKQGIAIPMAKTDEELTAPNMAIYAQDNILRDYSNQWDAGPVTNPVQASHDAPYVPSSSFSYQVIPDNSSEDSASQKAAEKYLMDIKTADRLNSVVVLNKIQKEMENSNCQLLAIERKNKNQILLDQQNVRPLLIKLHREIQVKKKELEKMRIRLRVSSQEIIHI